MKIYVLIPLHKIKNVKIKERDHCAARVALTSDYSEYFGKENEYYIDWELRVNKAMGWKTVSYCDCRTWYYTALNPHDVIKKKVIEVEEART